MLIVLTFDLTGPYKNGQPHNRVTKALKKNGFEKKSPRRGLKLPANTYTKEVAGKTTLEEMEKIRTRCFRTVRKIIKEEHGGAALIFLSVGGYWGTRVKATRN
jgi:hypothetical protein